MKDLPDESSIEKERQRRRNAEMIAAGTADKESLERGLGLILRELKQNKNHHKRITDRMGDIETQMADVQVLLATQQRHLVELDAFKSEATRAQIENRELVINSIRELKAQITKIQDTVADKLVGQERYFLDKTSELLETHDERTDRAFDRIIQRIEDKMARAAEIAKQDASVSNGKIEKIGRQQMKFLGGLIVVSFMISLFSFKLNLGEMTTAIKAKTGLSAKQHKELVSTIQAEVQAEDEHW
jgi:Fe2+ transport system protein B